ncbi:MAG: sulfatase-like hydrolase/transferase [Bacteroidetes bacterium]|nr:sulfatase-like hydrolase/transferase [Bacteroidota bacterium]
MKRYLQLSTILLLLAFASCRKTDFETSGPVDASDFDLSAAAAPPNIIIMLADDIGYEIPNYTGGQSYSTPNMNYIASHGMQFTQAHTAPLCSPSRTMLMTGKYNFRNYTTWGTLDTSSNYMIANMLKKKGYTTCMAGKWQFDGGDASIKAFGFDRYLVTNPFNVDFEDNGKLKFYKDPQIYENGAYWPDSKTKGKYGDDLIRDYMFNYIDSVTALPKRKPFFIYWATNLVHEPFCPTPDDPEFATWNSDKKKQPGDSIYFPSMVKYEDKLIGQLLNKLQDKKITGRTLVFFLGDNGTTADIHSLWNGQVVGGAKSSSTEAGTHVPMLAYMPGRILNNSVDTSLISLVDFFNTVADAGQTKIPKKYGTMDGISFYNQMFGDYTSVRPWIFCHFVGAGKNETNPLFLRRWMQDHTYKQYDTLPNPKFSKKFFNIILDPSESHPIPKSKMTTQEKQISNQFLQNMQQLH